MIKYQLERIKDMYSGISDPDRLDGIPVVTVAQSDIEWLIEQAERVQELETTVDFYQSALRDADRRVQELESRIADDEHFVVEILEQNKRYREALEFYANKINYLTFIENGKSNIEHDQGEKARKALEGHE